MDNTYLRRFEDLLSVAQRIAETTEHSGVASAPWGVWPASVFESFGAVTDMLARSTGAFPTNPHYVREKTGAMLSAVIHLYDKVMTVPACGHEEPDCVDDNGTIYTWTCDRNAGHTGNHEPMPATRRLEHDAHEVLATAKQLSAVIRWTLLNDGEALTHDSRQYVGEALTDLRGVLGEISQQLERLPVQ